MTKIIVEFVTSILLLRRYNRNYNAIYKTYQGIVTQSSVIIVALFGPMEGLQRALKTCAVEFE